MTSRSTRLVRRYSIILALGLMDTVSRLVRIGRQVRQGRRLT
ncbi:hypothetical protein [Brevundimonas sp.]